MIVANVPLQISQSRDIIRDPMNPPRLGEDTMRAPAMVPSRVVRSVVHVDVCHTEEHSGLIHNLLEAVQKISEVLPVNPFTCAHPVWSFIHKCKDVQCEDCGHVEPLSDKHKEHLPFKECDDKSCRQCDRGE